MIVGIETSSMDLSVAVLDPARGLEVDDAWTAGPRHASELLPRLVALAGRAGMELSGPRVIAVGLGPGSFTGLRVGMGVAKGLAFAGGAKLAGYPSLAAWLDAEPDTDAAIGRASVDEAYVMARGESQPAVVPFAAVTASMRRRPVVAATDLAATMGLELARSPRGAALALARRASYDQALPDDALATLEPLYVRAPRGVPAGVTPDASVIRALDDRA